MWILETDESVPDRTTFRIPSGSVKTIGRSTGAEFKLDAPLVSRLHCQLSATDKALQVKDLDSTNGTFVNARRITFAKLQPGDRLTVGRVELRISRTDS
jgi:pSer/pThr/pTyr-binding forkhead associated (FHA) protein